MTGFEVSAGALALARARDSDHRLWTTNTDSNHHRQLRNQAMAEALAAGVPREQIAAELGILSRDVDRMVSTTDLHLPGNRTPVGAGPST